MSKVKSQTSKVAPKALQKYGIGIFVRPPVLPEALEASFDVKAPPGVLVSREKDTVIIDVPDAFISEEPIRILGSGRGRAVVAIGRGAEVRIEESFAGRRDLTVALTLAESSKVAYRGIQKDRDGFVSRTASVARDASLRWTDIVLGGDFARAFTKTLLVGENAETETDAVFFGSAAQEFDLMHEAVHRASRTRSELRTRGILDGKAKTVARGLVRIEEGAVGCSGRQRIDTLMLSDDAEIDAVPHLEIANDDVSCAHAATVSRLDDAKLFYLMSRGMDRDAATRAYLEAFLRIDDEALLEDVMKTYGRP